MIFRLALVFCLGTSFTFAAEKPNTLTPKEIEEGWILLFDGETTFGWTVNGDVTATKGELHLGGEKATVVSTTAKFQRFDLAFECDLEKKAAVQVSALGQTKTLEQLNTNGGWVQSRFSASPNANGEVFSSINQKGTNSELWSKNINLGKNPEPTFIQFTVANNAKLHLRNIKLRPLGTMPLFNGKDLTGWKIFDDPKRNQSKWSVTKEGWLNVKNGPGDLQTEKQFDNFVLQFECISNGKALNSGIFFRCVANEYQNGYEMQIQNGYKDDDRTKPADFGTGAIYRRVPARKVVSNDNEWFTMTLIANGNQISTWVNGYQTVDWTDDRAADDNPRKGSKTGKGHLSIQGHDPTTDLSFRNIRIAELRTPKK